MREIHKYQVREICYPIGNLSCIPEKADIVIKQDEKWCFKYKGDTQCRFLDIVDAPDMGYYVPKADNVTSLTNLHQIYLWLGLLILAIGICVVSGSEYFFQGLTLFWGDFFTLSLLELILIFIGITIGFFIIMQGVASLVARFKVIIS